MEEVKRMDLLDWVGADAAARVLMGLDDPADLVRATCVSKSWSRFVIANGFCKKLCVRMCPEVLIFTHVIEEGSSAEVADVGSSSSDEWASMEREHRVYSCLSHHLISRLAKADCISEPIGASSTDNYPEESVDYTLEPTDRVELRPSYWSSKGETDPRVPEKLTYRLNSNLCVVTEIKIQPFKAYFQIGNPVYSALAVLFRMGYPKLAQEATAEEYSSRQEVTDDNYIWTYVSPEFPMLQESNLQSFKLPRPVLCIGGIVQIELLGRVQKQDIDGLYYICVCHVKVIGRKLAPLFDSNILHCNKGIPVLQYFPDMRVSTTPETQETEDRSKSSWQAFAMRIRELRWNRAILNTLLGAIPIIVDDYNDGPDEEPELEPPT
ncbi:F-box protein-like [Iris pallida]|uniref:F-box protein-like n=1 Tax=Iris pallida TaxID=29817 RepID=A0AAX6GQ32_IRIPA|nr:F-box protein-like [Iris pallida]KAJ6840460.1 F-box protein-like [Iris pallida]